MPQEDDGQDKAKIWAELDGTADQGQAAGSPATTTAADAGSQTSDNAAATQTPADQAGATQAAADPFEGWPETAKHTVLGLQSQVEQVMQRLRNAEGHIGGLKSTLTQRSQTDQAGDGAPSAKEIREAQRDPKAMKALLESYPEFGASMRDALHEELDPVKTEIETLKQQLGNGQPSAVTREELTQQIANLQIETRHPGWQATVKTPAFAGWLQTQSREVQLLAGSNAVEDAVRLLDLHSQAITRGRETRDTRQAAAASIPTGRSGVARTKPLDSMSKAELWAYQDSIEASKG